MKGPTDRPTTAATVHTCALPRSCPNVIDRGATWQVLVRVPAGAAAKKREGDGASCAGRCSYSAAHTRAHTQTHSNTARTKAEFARSYQAALQRGTQGGGTPPPPPRPPAARLHRGGTSSCCSCAAGTADLVRCPSSCECSASATRERSHLKQIGSSAEANS